MAKVRSRLPKFPPYPIYPPSGPSSLDANQVTGTVGDGSTQEPVITHNLGTKAIHASFWLTASPFTNVDVEFEITDTNTITLKVIGTPLTSGELSYFISRR